MLWGGHPVLAAGSGWDAWGALALTCGSSVWATGFSEGAWRHPAGCKLGGVTARTSLLLACECEVHRSTLSGESSMEKHSSFKTSAVKNYGHVLNLC